MGGNICRKWDRNGVYWEYCMCPSCQARQRAKANRQYQEFRRDSSHQDSRKVHDTKGKNNHGRSSW